MALRTTPGIKRTLCFGRTFHGCDAVLQPFTHTGRTSGAWGRSRCETGRGRCSRHWLLGRRLHSILAILLFDDDVVLDISGCFFIFGVVLDDLLALCFAREQQAWLHRRSGESSRWAADLFAIQKIIGGFAIPISRAVITIGLPECLSSAGFRLVKIARNTKEGLVLTIRRLCHPSAEQHPP